MNMKSILVVACLVAVLSAPLAHAGFLPGERVLVEAHNCYPYHGMWNNRIDRALSTTFPCRG